MQVVVVTDELNTWASTETPFVFHVATKVDAFLESTGPMTTLMNVIIHEVASRAPEKARKRIKDCTLFVPFISANTDARSEGYFRLEWKLAVDRSHLMAHDQPFLLPVALYSLALGGLLLAGGFAIVLLFRLRDWHPAGAVVAALLLVWTYERTTRW